MLPNQKQELNPWKKKRLNAPVADLSRFYFESPKALFVDAVVMSGRSNPNARRQYDNRNKT
jgi:hypothetical protein